MTEKNTATVEVRGVEAEYRPDVLRSAKFGMAIGDLSDDDLTEEEKLVVNARLMRMLFGEGRYRLMEALEEEGVEFQEWLPEFFEAVGAKN